LLAADHAAQDAAQHRADPGLLGPVGARVVLDRHDAPAQVEAFAADEERVELQLQAAALRAAREESGSSRRSMMSEPAGTRSSRSSRALMCAMSSRRAPTSWRRSATSS